MYDQRVLFKNQMIKEQKRLETIPKEDTVKRKECEYEIVKYNNNQMVRKISLNSCYGALGNQYFRYFNREIAEGITTAEDLEAQRKAFSQFSNAITSYFKVSLSTGTLYRQHCPMAFDGKGADWLSKESAIKNPYFGDKMLNCGSVTATITN